MCLANEDVTSAHAARVIDAQFPDLAPARVRWLGEGCDSVAFEVNDVWVFRFPRRDDVDAQLAIEAALLPVIAPRLPLAVPLFEYIGRADALHQRGFAGYRKLPGVPAISVDAGALPAAETAALGRFLGALHAVPPEQAAACGAPALNAADHLDAVRADALGDLAEVGRLAGDAPLDAWRQFLEAPPPLPAGRHVLAHTDLAAEHVLIDRDGMRLTAVIDWSDAAITLAAIDFAGLFHWGGEPLVQAVLPSYENVGGAVGQDALRFGRYLGACRGAMDVAFGVEQRRPEYVGAGLRALYLCAGE